MSNEKPTQVNLVFALAIGAAAFFAYQSMVKNEALDNTNRQLEIERTKVDQIERTIDKLRNFN